MNYPASVKIVEVGPRDGLQNEKVAVDVDTKVELVGRLTDAGLRTIEAGSFVSPKWVPQMAGSDEVFARLPAQGNTTYAALTPNMQGLERAIACGVKEVAVFAAASESFSQKILIVRLPKVSSASNPSLKRPLVRGWPCADIFPVWLAALMKERSMQRRFSPWPNSYW